MTGFNLSVDFELGWGDLDRLAVDDNFYRRVVDGRGHSTKFIELLDRYAIKSTWGVVGACCFERIEQLRQAAPQSFQIVEQQLTRLMSSRRGYSEVLFCPDTVAAVAGSANIELASHGFLHLVAQGNDPAALQEDAAASARILGDFGGATIQSFIAPRNYYWPDEAFADTTIRYIRHSPTILGQTYSNTNIPAKFARLWNDFLRPTIIRGTNGQAALLLYLRIDRGEPLWSSQLKLIRRLLESDSGSLYCYTHPHNIDSSDSLRRMTQLCELVCECRDKQPMACPPFAREVKPV